MAGCRAVTLGVKGGVVAGGFECSLLELDLIGDALGADVRAFPFQVPTHGEHPDDRRRLAAVAQESLAAKGLVDGGSFAPEVERLLGVFAAGVVAIALLGSTRDRPHRVRVVLDGQMGVLATQHGQVVRFTPINPDSAVRSVVGALPAMRPGPGSSVTITAPDGAPARSERPAGDEDISRRSYLEVARPPATSAGTQQAVAEQILRRPRLGSGYITITTRSRNGREDDEPATVSWLDTDAGRYAVIPSTGPDGRLSVTYTPADLRRLEQSVSRFVSRLS